MSPENTVTTRRLCANAHLNVAFRRRVLSQMLHEKHKAVTCSFGVDTALVLRQCIIAKRRVGVRNILLLLIFLILVGQTRELFPHTPRPLFTVLSVYLLPSTLLRILKSPLFGVACAIVLWDIWTCHQQTVSRLFGKNASDTDWLRKPLGPQTDKVIQEASQREAGNLVVYSGFSPFVGSGYDIGGWSFALNVGKGRQEMERTRRPQPFEIREFYDHMCSTLADLGIKSLCIEDRLYIEGRSLRGHPTFLPEVLQCPPHCVDASVMDAFVGHYTEAIRHYKCLRIMSWDGEMVISIFFRLSKVGDNLFAEASYFLLPPLKAEYQRLEAKYPITHWLNTVKLVLASVFYTPFLLLASPFSVLSGVLEPVIRWVQVMNVRELIQSDRTFDYGTTGSLRQTESAPAYQHYFQKLDKEMYLKVVERQLLDGMVQFLDRHDIDTTDIKQRQTTILNKGLIMSGGAIQTENMTIGEKAKTVMTNLMRASEATSKGPTLADTPQM